MATHQASQTKPSATALPKIEDRRFSLHGLDAVSSAMLHDIEAFPLEKQNHFVPSSSSQSASPLQKSTSPAETEHSYAHGYPRLAFRMAHSQQSAMFRRFGTLNVQNLLYYQAELQGLENQLRRLETADARAGTDGGDGEEKWRRAMYSRDWFWLGDSKLSDGPAGDQARLFDRIRILLKEYSKSVFFF